ncbi:amidohydrolase family protein [Shewanella sp. D64]|uniref:amidohydrolase family protein n=1 Tax=unclassified Shewanella TaxID=196818 RepID=UPI0022BA3B81|nr:MULTISPECIES: amidohydrolase family protein [unclassified Shewanella]MEC4726888.1 amidohydrolase family protein [Shewanella sp. D64]MEC4738615.1 amidohydrolase family protein [Shewanella sp. E94]WBJ98216.1 amidohydrolase family protein [Shewanella sp. MTB7]
MHNNIKSITIIAAFTLAYTSDTIANDQLTDNTPKITALTHATLMVEPGVRLEDSTLLIKKNKIVGIVKNNNIPKHAYVINLNGYTIYPGFIDPFTNYAIDFEYPKTEVKPPVYEIKRIGGNAKNGAIHAEKEWFNFVYPNKDRALDWIQNGFTSVQSSNLDGIFRGRGVTLSLADKHANQIIYPAKSNHFMAFNKGSSPQDYPGSLMGSMALIRQTLSDANWYNENKTKSFSKHQNLIVEFNTALAGLGYIKNETIIFDSRNLNNQLRAAHMLNEHNLTAHLLGNGKEYIRINELKAFPFSLILPLNFPESPKVSDNDNEREISLASMRHWERAPSNLKTVSDAEIPFAITQYGINAELFWPRLKQAIHSGLSETAALAALTTDAAEMAGISEISGRLKAGFMADLVITKGNIFQDGEIHSVWLQGDEKQLIDRNTYLLDHIFQLQVGDLTLDLELDRTDKDKLTGFLSSGEQQITLHNLNYHDHRLTFNAKLDSAGFEGINRFTLWFDEQGIHGRMLDKHNVVTSVAGLITEQVIPKPVLEPKQARGYVSTLTQPNVAYGRETALKPEKLHISNATIWTSDKQGIIEHSDLLISQGQIERIGQQLSTPSGYQFIDATGKHVTAGIIDEHSHIAINGGTNEGTDAITSEVRIGDVINPDDIAIYRALAGGVTTAQLLHGSANPIGGQAQIIQMKWGENATKLKYTQAPASIKFALGENVKQSNWGDNFTQRFPQSRMGVKSLFTEAFNEARAYQDALDNYQKLRGSEKRRRVAPQPNYRLDAIVEVLEQEREVHIHSYVQSEILMFLRLAEAYKFKVGTFTHILEGYKVADEIAAHGASASTFSDWWAYKFEVYDAIPQNTCLMQNSGILTSINSDDYEMQRRLNQEAAKSIMYCDMSPENAWNMITINPAIQLGIDQALGSITKGKQADIVLWDHSPLSVYAKVESTWIEGKRYFDRSVDKQMQRQVSEERAALIQKILISQNSENPLPPGKVVEEIWEPKWHCDTQYDVWQHARQGGERL